MKGARRFLAGLSPEQFLKQYWQKKPLLCRGSLSNYRAPLTPDELAGLACEEDVESRLVVRRGQRYQLETGPFPETRFAQLGEKNWTLLVQDLDVHVPEVGHLLQNLDFLPSWRVDDVMASFAADGGTVGPHYDEYDVFLLQVEGKRRWQISAQFDRNDLVSNSQLKLLRQFHAEEEWVLEPGDMLYLPPHVAHFGVAQGPCVTYSLGCRAPSASDLIQHFARHAAEAKGEGDRYADADLKASPQRFAVDDASLRRTRTLLREALTFDDEQLARGLGTLTTLPKALFAAEADSPLTAGQAQKKLLQRRGLQRRMGSRWSYYVASDATFLFVDGRELRFQGNAQFAEALCASSTHAAEWLAREAKRPAQRQLLLELIAQRYLE